MHINNKINVSVKAMCRVATKKLLNKALQIRREHAGSLFQAARLVQSMELILIIKTNYIYVSNHCTYHFPLITL